MLRLVFDTNAVLDLLVFNDPRTLPIALALADGRARCFADDDGLLELERVLAYPALRLSTADAERTMASFRALAECFPAAPEDPALPHCRDPDDQKFLDLAAAIGADILLTRDRALLDMNRKIRASLPSLAIITPEALSNRLGAAVGKDVLINSPI